jgi:2-oxoglutarate decarboxylase
MDFAHFWTAYEEIVKKARGGKLTVDDFAGTTISLTNPGTIGTVHSVPRLMQGQGAIIGVGRAGVPGRVAGREQRDPQPQCRQSKILTLTSRPMTTGSSRAPRAVTSSGSCTTCCSASDRFYDEIFESLRIPYEPVRWVQDVTATTTTTSTRSPGFRRSSTPTGCAGT